MDHCCSKKSSELEIMRKNKQSKVLWFVLFINLAMFFLEIYFGFLSNSTALLSDSLDMLGDSLVYGFSIYVITKSNNWRVLASLSKAMIMFIFGLIVLSKIIYQLIYPVVPNYETMSFIGLIALFANLVCFYMLYKFKNQDTNMKSTWLCSRNDIIANISVLISAFIVSLTKSAIPDIIVGLGITILFLSSSFHILKLSIKDLKENKMLSPT